MTGETHRSAGRPAAILVGTLLLATFAALIALGTWQVQRLGWKENLIATIQSRINATPVPLDDVLAGGTDFEYVPVSVSGRFDHAHERHFFTTFNGESGYNVYTPLVRADGSAVFVNRGFVPFDRKNPGTRVAGQVEGDVTVTGLARTALTEKPSWIVPDNDAAKNIYYWKDIRAMAENSGRPPAAYLGLFVDAGNTPNPGGLPVGGTTIVDLPNSHLQYAVTWYGLAAALVAVTLAWLWRARRQPRP